MQSLCKELAVRDDIVLTVVDIRTSNLAKIAVRASSLAPRFLCALAESWRVERCVLTAAVSGGYDDASVLGARRGCKHYA
jgi:hypothetical protein